MTFSEFWDAYPRRKGANPRFPAEKKYLAAICDGADEQHIISSAKRYADELKTQGKLETEFVCMAQTWLNQKRWIDYAPSDYEEKKFAETQEKMAKIGWKWVGHPIGWVKTDSLSG